MAAIPATFSELRSAFRGFKNHANTATTNRYTCLDILYAVECGLKALVLSEKRCDSTDKLDERLKTHDINKIADMCNPKITHKLDGFVYLGRGRRHQKRIPIEQFHQALRYGIKLSDAEIEKHAEKLDALYEIVNNHLNRR